MTKHNTNSKPTFIPSTDIYETPQNFIVVAEIPGSDADSVTITFEHNTLHFTAQSKALTPEQYSLIYSEYRLGHYERSLSLSTEVDADHIVATVKDGILKMTLPKKQPKTKTISITNE